MSQEERDRLFEKHSTEIGISKAVRLIKHREIIPAKEALLKSVSRR